FGHPFAMDTHLWDQIIVYHDIALSRIRISRRGVFNVMSELMHYSIDSSESLQSALGTAQEMQSCRAEIYKSLPVENGLRGTYKRQANSYAAFQVSLLKNLNLRCASHQARLADKSSLRFNNITLRDSNFVKSITFLTMIFLPATFVSAVFSISFFTFGDKGWEVSDQVWIYWATIIPVTVVVIVLWFVWVFWQSIRAWISPS
ncbi:hypothetical protein C8A00DRAFT_19745, partial [Chaetomidium leptoderma]